MGPAGQRGAAWAGQACSWAVVCGGGGGALQPCHPRRVPAPPGSLHTQPTMPVPTGLLPLPGPVPQGRVSGTWGPDSWTLSPSIPFQDKIFHVSSLSLRRPSLPAKAPFLFFGSQTPSRLSHPPPLGGLTVCGGRGQSRLLPASPCPQPPLTAPSHCCAGGCHSCPQSGLLPWAPADRRGPRSVEGSVLHCGWRAMNPGDCAWASCFLSPRSGLALVLGIFLWLPDGHQKMSETSPGLLTHLIQEASLCQGSWDSGPAVHLPGCLPSSVPRGGCHLFPGEAGGTVFDVPPDNQALLLSVVFRGTCPCSLASTQQSSRNLPAAVNKTGRRRTQGEGGQDRRKGAEPAGGHCWKWVLGSWGPGVLGLPQHTPPTRGLSSRNLLSPSSQPEVQG